MRMVSTCFLFALISASANSEEHRLEQSFRDTKLLSDVEILRKSLDEEHVVPKSLEEAADRIVESLPRDLKSDASFASKVGVSKSKGLDGVPAHARAVVFAEVFFDRLWKGKVAASLPTSIQVENRGIVLYGYFESVLNEYAISWGMRGLDTRAPLTSDCRAAGAEDVNVCLKVLTMYGFSKALHLTPRLSIVDFISLYE